MKDVLSNNGLDEAIAHSALATLDSALVRRLLSAGDIVALPAGTDLSKGADDEPFSYLVVAGILRTYGSSEGGRQSTLRYARRGALLGVPSLFHGPVAGVIVGAVVHARVIPLNADVVRELARDNVAVAHALLVDQTALVNGYLQTLMGTTTSTLRQNILRHLLDLATFRSRDHALVARISQQQLANHAGTVREVVGRLLKELRDQGVVTTARDQITLLDPERLANATWPRTF